MSAVVVSQDADLNFFDVPAFARQALSNRRSLAALIDHTILKPDATESQVVQHCSEAVRYGFACVMVNPCWTALAHSVLDGTQVKSGCVVGFPLGASLMTNKREEADQLLRLGARELDMVLNIGALKSGNRRMVEQDIRAVVEVAQDAGAIVKVILETCLLTLEEKIVASELAIAAGADFLKTSTGFSTGGATVHDVGLLRGIAGSRCHVKAAGGIRNLEQARQMIEAGASRIGTSAGVLIIREMGPDEMNPE
jgi:deoxyribose-phosphate aldolase